MTYCILRRDFLLGLVQGVNLAAIVTTLVLVRRSDRLCPHHVQAAETASSA